MVLKRSLSDDWLSCTYLVGSGAHEAFFVDAGGPVEPLIDAARKHDLRITHVLLTHHHHDHVAELAAIKEAFGDVEVLIHPLEADLVDGVTGTIEDGAVVRAGGMDVRAIHTPGHTKGMLAFVCGDDVFTGDTLFKGSVGGVRAPEHTTYADLRSSIMDKLMKLDPGMQIRPGHTDPTTVGEEWERNPFIRLWRGLDEEGSDEVTVMGERATLILLGPDYDGGHKAWIRWADGRDDIVPGSLVQREG
jgi:glyoxylase-like metal-dependent hydrolase (beta-lactamase superfamily II)